MVPSAAGGQIAVPTTTEVAGLRAWLGLAVGVLIAAGCFAVLLVFARMPPFDRLVTDPDFFRRCLVVHVDLALVAWFVSFIVAMSFRLPEPGRAGRWTVGAAWVSAGGLGVMGLAVATPGSEAVMANYVPVIDHPLFGIGLATFGVGVVAALADGRLWSTRADSAAAPGIAAAGVALLLAGVTFFASWLGGPAGVPGETGFELLMWGGGHVLQLASETAMVAAWLYLLEESTGRPVMRRGTAAAGFVLLVLPWFAAPLLTGFGLHSSAYYHGFTQLMRWGIFPVVSLFLLACFAAARRAPTGDPRVAGFYVSAVLTVLGFVLGALIRGSNTVIPAHYHASIGAVTVAFMALAPGLLGAAGYAKCSPSRLARWQPVLFGSGQFVFAVGFAFAGAHGSARKVYGAEQLARSPLETLGLAVMGLGGIVAVAGGIAFLWIVVQRWLGPGSLLTRLPWRSSWPRRRTQSNA